SYYSFFGQLVLLSIFQIGGIGYMAFFVFLAYLLGKKFSKKTSTVAKESMATDSHSLHMLGGFFLKVIIFTLFFEIIGTVILAFYWAGEYSLPRALYLGLFHSVSGFCTAGFGLFPTSLINYQTSWTVNLTINIISIVGGLGFFVLSDFYNALINKIKRLKPARLTLHSKMVILTTAIVMLAGTVVILVAEQWPSSVTLQDKILIASFQSISASTTDGYNSIDIGKMSATSLVALMLLMFIGASPGSTGGGMKTTTLATLFAAVRASLQGKDRTAVFERKIPIEIIIKAMTIFFLFSAVAAIDILIMANTEQASFLQTLFEIVSALGNTGLSTGITGSLSTAGKIILIVTMFIGRVGPLTIGSAIFKSETHNALKLPKEELFVG
ncbi:MAG: potassium transporter TrkG, partial [Candidatus Margulisiibacteriota bacterium]